jgi:hypothetical protein
MLPIQRECKTVFALNAQRNNTSLSAQKWVFTRESGASMPQGCIEVVWFSLMAVEQTTAGATR